MLLLVDHDPVFLEAAERFLRPGYTVFFARNAEHAYQLMTTVGAGFSVVLIDLDLPGQDGFSLVYKMRHHSPICPLSLSAESLMKRT